MLVRLFGENFRSLKKSFELSLVAADLKRKEDRERGAIEAWIAGVDQPLRLLRMAAIFGHNGSGKSTVLRASHALNWLVTQSSQQNKPGGRIPPYEPFRLDGSTRVAPVTLGCEVVHGDRLLRYEISYREKTIERETLVLADGNTEATLIERQPSGEVLGDLIKNSEANRLYVTEMQPNVAVLSKLAQHGPAKGPDSVRPFFDAIVRATKYEDYSVAAAMRFSFGDSDADRFADDGDYRAWIMERLIAPADLGIRDVKTRREDVELPEFFKQVAAKEDGSKFPDKRVVVSFLHGEGDEAAIDFGDESAGTKKLFNVAGDWWTLAHEDVTLFADEMGASLHPRLIDSLIRALNDAPKAQSQMVFATHDTGLLESTDGLPPALRRDQVYFTRKNTDGSTELFSLAEFKDGARSVHNLRKRYLSGIYGAIPSSVRVSL